METSDADPQPRLREQSTRVPGHPTLAEQMRAKAATGELLDPGGDPFDPDAMQDWGNERTVSAAVLRNLLVGRPWPPIHAKGVRLRGVWISGLLDLEGATLRCPLSLDSCYFDGAVRLDHVTASRIVLTRCKLAGLTAIMLRAGQIDLSRSTLRTGPLLLMGADITGDLICSGAQLNDTDSDRNALVAGGMKVGGSVYLDQLDGPFTATGAVWLARADIASDLACSGAQLGKNRDGIGLLADGIRVGGEVFLREGFTADGAVRLLGADITGDLSCRDAHLGHDRDGNALVADRMKVGGEVHLYKGFTAAGAVVLKGADITGDLSLRGAQLNGKNRDGNALDADGMKAGHDVLLDKEPDDDGTERPFTAAGAVRLARADITGQLRCSGAQLTGSDRAGLPDGPGNALVGDEIKVGAAVLLDEGFTAAGTVSLNSARADVLRWAPDGQFSWPVSLEDAHVGELEDKWPQAGEQAASGYWPLGGRLRLNGFTYQRLGKAKVKQRLGWIQSQYQGDERADFAAQPYEQLADMYRRTGQEGEARVVAIARHRDLRKYGKLNWYRRFGNWFLDKTIRFGYQTWRAAALLAIVFVAFLVLSIVGQHQHVIVPTGDTTGLHPMPTATQCTSNYPCFYPFGYTVDTVIPIINVHQADYWRPNGHAPSGWLWVVGAWGATAAGWALATLLIAGYTGLVRQN